MGNGLRLVFFNGDGARHATHGLLQQGGTHHHLLAFFQQGAEVRGKVRFAFATVDNHALALGTRRRAQLHVRGEGSTAQTHDATQANLVDNGLGVLRNGGHQGFAAVDAFQPFVAFYGNLNVRRRTAGEVCARSDGFYRTGHGGVDESAHKATGLGNHLTHFHLVAHGHAGHRRCANVLGNGNVHGRGDGKRLNGAFPGDFAVVRMYTADTECMLRHWQPPLLFVDES